MPAFFCYENKLQPLVCAAYATILSGMPLFYALCMMHKNSTWNLLEAQISETVLALTKVFVHDHGSG